MKSSYGWIFIGVFFIIEGIISLMGYKIFLKYSSWTNISTTGSLYLIIIGFGLIYFGYFQRKKIEFSICPNCKESFNYNELKNGKCKYCEDVDTIDIEEYYKNNPDEKE